MILMPTLKKNALLLGSMIAFQSAFAVDEDFEQNEVWTHVRNSDQVLKTDFGKGDDISLSSTDLDPAKFDEPRFAGMVVEAHQGEGKGGGNGYQVYLRLGKWIYDPDDHNFRIHMPEGNREIRLCNKSRDVGIDRCQDGHRPSISINNRGEILVYGKGFVDGDGYTKDYLTSMGLSIDPMGEVVLVGPDKNGGSEHSDSKSSFALERITFTSVSLNNNSDFVYGYTAKRQGIDDHQELFIGAGTLSGRIDDKLSIDIKPVEFRKNGAEFLDLALNDNGDVVSVHVFDSRMYVCTGTLNKEESSGIQWYQDKCPQLESVYPANRSEVSINNQGIVNLIFNRGRDEQTYHLRGKLIPDPSESEPDMTKIDWEKEELLFNGAANFSPGATITNEGFTGAIYRGVYRGHGMKTGRAAEYKLLTNELDHGFCSDEYGESCNVWKGEYGVYTQKVTLGEKLDKNQTYQLSVYVIEGSHIESLTYKFGKSNKVIDIFNNKLTLSGDFYTSPPIDPKADFEELELTLITYENKEPADVISHITLDRVNEDSGTDATMKETM